MVAGVKYGETVCLSVRLSREEAKQVREWAAAHRITVQQVLRQCVTSATEVMASYAPPYIVSAEEAARGVSDAPPAATGRGGDA